MTDSHPTVDTRPNDRVDPAYVASAPDYSRQLSSPSSNDPHAHFIPPALLQTSSASSLPDHYEALNSPLASPSSPSLPPFDEDKADKPEPRHPHSYTHDDKEKALLSSTHSLTIAPDSKHLASAPERKEDPHLPAKADVEDHHSGPADLSKVDPDVLTTDPRKGLTTDMATERLTQYGYNEIQEHKPSALLKFLSYFTGSIAYLIEAAAILSGALQDWTDFGIITALLFVNAFIGFMEESRAESAVDALKSTLALRCRVMRDGHMVEMEARCIVPGDIISLRTGDVISADAIVLPRVHKNAVYKGMGFAEHEELPAGSSTADDDHDDQPVELSADQSALTGESLPTMKHPRDLLYSSSIVKSGQAMALVIKTGENTFVGRAANLIAITTDAGHFQKVIQKIGNFLVAITIVMVVIILIVGTTAQGHGFASQLQNCLVICIASIPVGLPTVLSVTMAVGAKQLAAKQVIVKRLTAVEEMAGIDILCSDKTGTLTKNELQLDKPYLVAGYTQTDLLLYGFLASEHATKDAIDLCLRRAACLQVPPLKEAGLQADSPETPGFHILKHEPFTSSTKMATTALRDNSTKEVFMVAKGAPQVILRMCKLPAGDHKKADDAIVQMAKQGLRALGVAVSKPYTGKAPANIKELDWQLVGCVSLLDPPRDDSAETIRRCNEFGIGVKMITGDTILIAKEVAKRLGMDRNILSPAIIQTPETAAHGHGDPPPSNAPPAPVYTEKQLIHMVRKADGFGQVVPEDKYRVVEILQNGGHLVGMTGDGVNDAPALKKANVGIAVHGCTDAARAAAAIVLLQPGLGTIADGVMTSRQIFQRMRSYSLYRITSTIHFLIFLFIAIIAFDFTIPAVLIVLITVMNDAATLVISVDNAQISHRPDKWRIGQLISLSFVLAILLALASFGHFFIFKYAIGSSDDELGTIMYLQMSSCPHFVIFSTRLPRAWYTQPPSWIFFVAVMGTQVIAMFFAVYGVLSTAIGWPSSLAIMAVSLVYFMFLDQVKLFVYAHWSYELTVKLWPTRARKEVRDEKREKKAAMARFAKGARVGRRLINECKFVLLCQQAVENSRLREVVVLKKAPDMPLPVKYSEVQMTEVHG